MKKEIRVYAIGISMLDDDYDKDIRTVTDSEFMNIAEEQGLVFTLNSFQESFNSNENISTDEHIIRFIEVEI